MNTIKEEVNLENLPYNADKLYLQHPRASIFYMLPKIHKPNNPGRPIAGPSELGGWGLGGFSPPKIC